jgi:hypothetical protein
MIRVNRHTSGPRVYIVGRRLHHGPAFGLAALLTWRWRPLSAALAVVAASDWRDFPFRDCDNH